MIGKINPKSKHVSVIGGGISGLLAAYTLSQEGYEVHLIEAHSRLGGLIETQSSPWGMAEAAAHSLLVNPNVESFFQELQVKLLELRPESRARYIFRRGKLRRFPLGPLESLWAFIRAYFVLADRKKSPEELTLKEWTERYLGRAALEYLMTPMLYGIYGSDPSELTVGCAFPGLVIPRGHSFLSFQLSRLIRTKNRKKKPRARMQTPENGMESLIQALRQKLENDPRVRISLNQKVDELPSTDNLVIALPADQAALLLKHHDPALSKSLKEVSYTPLITATIFIGKDTLTQPIQGVGVLIPKVENRKALGILFNSSSFAHRVNEEDQHISLTMMLGGSKNPEFMELSDTEVHAIISSELEAILGIKAPPIGVLITRWPQAIPKYNQHLMNTWNLARQGWCQTPGHILTGNYTGEVSIRGMIEGRFSWRD